MKKLTLLTLVVVGTSLVACGKESDFKKAINAKISQNPECLNIYNSSIYTYGTNKDAAAKLEEATKGKFVVSQQFDNTGKNKSYSDKQDQEKLSKLNALASAGLLSKSTESLPTQDWNKKPDGGYYTYTIYTLTDAGKATAAKVETNGLAKSMFGDSGNRIFCYATPEVVKIENYTEGSYGGMDIVEVKYSYKYTNVADWANNADVKAAFPEISKNLENPDKTNKTELIKTKNGWSTDLD